MKTLSAGLLAMAAQRVHTWAWAIRLTRRDGVVFRYTSGSSEATIDGGLYLAAPGFDVSNITCTLGFNVDTLELTVLNSDDLTRADFLAGRWDDAVVELNQYDWTTPASGFNPWPKYTVSNVKPMMGGFQIELRDQRQWMQQDHTRNITKTCPYRLGDARCAKVLTSFTHTFTVTSVTSRSIFTCSGLAQAATYFDNGEVYFDDGLYGDIGFPLAILSHATGGVITLAVPLIADIVPGQTGTIIAGCLKRFDEDCKTKFSNVLNFGGHKDQPTRSDLVGQDA